LDVISGLTSTKVLQNYMLTARDYSIFRRILVSINIIANSATGGVDGFAIQRCNNDYLLKNKNGKIR
jgi:hypothetical protein